MRGAQWSQATGRPSPQSLVALRKENGPRAKRSMRYLTQEYPLENAFHTCLGCRGEAQGRPLEQGPENGETPW